MPKSKTDFEKWQLKNEIEVDKVRFLTFISCIRSYKPGWYVPGKFVSWNRFAKKFNRTYKQKRDTVEIVRCLREYGYYKKIVEKRKKRKRGDTVVRGFIAKELS